MFGCAETILSLFAILKVKSTEIEKLKSRIAEFEDDDKTKTEYVKQLEDMLPNSKRKKLGLKSSRTW